MGSCLRRDLNSLRCNVVHPSEYQRDRKTDQQKRDHKAQTPIRQFPCWKHGRGDLNQEPRGNDVSGGDAINLSALQFLKEPAHNIWVDHDHSLMPRVRSQIYVRNRFVNSPFYFATLRGTSAYADVKIVQRGSPGALLQVL